MANTVKSGAFKNIFVVYGPIVIKRVPKASRVYRVPNVGIGEYDALLKSNLAEVCSFTSSHTLS